MNNLGLCWAYCGLSLSSGEWCYTTKKSTGLWKGDYVACTKDSGEVKLTFDEKTRSNIIINIIISQYVFSQNVKNVGHVEVHVLCFNHRHGMIILKNYGILSERKQINWIFSNYLLEFEFKLNIS